MNRLRPWVKLPRVTCERCDEQATHRVTAATLDVADQDGEAGPIALVSTPDLAAGSVLACEHHIDDLMEQFMQVHDMAASEPLRDTWNYWLLYQCFLLHWVGTLEIAFHNVRWERIPGDSVWRMVPDFIEEMRELRRFRKT